MMADRLLNDFKSLLDDLTSVTSKPLIHLLTKFAAQNMQYAEQIVSVIYGHLERVEPGRKLSVLYLIESIIRNIPNSNYLQLFTKNIVHNFVLVFQQVDDDETRESLLKLRQSWSQIKLFPNLKLYALDVCISDIDDTWPITAHPLLSVNSPVQNLALPPEMTTTTAPQVSLSLADTTVISSPVDTTPSTADGSQTVSHQGTQLATAQPLLTCDAVSPAAVARQPCTKSVCLNSLLPVDKLQSGVHCCEFCSRVFVNEAQLWGHLRVHRELHVRECEICDQQFKNKTGLRAHIRVHGANTQAHPSPSIAADKVFTAEKLPTGNSQSQPQRATTLTETKRSLARNPMVRLHQHTETRGELKLKRPRKSLCLGVEVKKELVTITGSTKTTDNEVVGSIDHRSADDHDNGMKTSARSRPCSGSSR